MARNMSELQQFGKDQLEAAGSVAASLAKGLQAIAAETTEFSKNTIEANSAFLEKLLDANSLENAIQIQSEYAKSNYERLMAQATKIGELYANLAKETLRPAEIATSRFQAAASAVAPAPQEKVVASKRS